MRRTKGAAHCMPGCRQRAGLLSGQGVMTARGRHRSRAGCHPRAAIAPTRHAGSTDEPSPSREDVPPSTSYSPVTLYSAIALIGRPCAVAVSATWQSVRFRMDSGRVVRTACLRSRPDARPRSGVPSRRAEAVFRCDAERRKASAINRRRRRAASVFPLVHAQRRVPLGGRVPLRATFGRHRARAARRCR